MNRTPRRRNILSAVGIGLAGVVGGGILAVGATASAQDTAQDTGPGTSSDSRSLVERFSGERGERGERGTVDDAVAAQVEQAVLAAYDGASVDRVHEVRPETGQQPAYAAHVRTADGERLHVLLDDGFTITGEEEPREPRGRHGGPAGMHTQPGEEALASIQAAVAEAYDGATAERVREVTTPEGETAYVAHVAGDDQHLHVLLDESFTVIEEIERPEPGQRPERGADGPGVQSSSAVAGTRA